MKIIKQFAVLLVSLVKWLALSVAVGAAAGGVVCLFVKLLNLAIGFVQRAEWFFALLPAALFLSALIVRYLAPEAAGHGTEKVIEAIHRRDGKIDLKVVPVKILASVVTIAGGGSAGREGPSTQIGAGVASAFAALLRLRPRDRRVLVIAGLAAGFSAVFSAPVAGAVFAVEVLVCGKILFDGLLPSVAASVASVTVYRALGGLIGVGENFSFRFDLGFSLPTLGWCLLAGLFFGLTAFTFIKSMGLFERLAHRVKVWPPLKGLIGGGALALLTLAFGTEFLSVGGEVSDGLIAGTVSLASVGYAAFLVKILFTSITLGWGGSGGAISPVVFIGASAGALFGMMTGNVQLFAALGLVGVLAGCTNTPLAAVVLSAELFGGSVLPYAAVVAVVSYLIVGYNSIYPSQILDVKKSFSLVPDGLGGEFSAVGGVRFSAFAERCFAAFGKLIRRGKRTEQPSGEEKRSMKEFEKLSERAKSALQVLCSNYRESMTVTAEFRCREAYGIDRFMKEVRRYLGQIKRQKFVTDYSVGEPEEENGVYAFTVRADMNMSVEEMAEVCLNSQTIYRQD